MNAVLIGPLVFAPDRFAAILAIAAFLIICEVLSRKVDGRFSSWGWLSVVLFITGARVGHVVMNADGFLEEPWRVLAVWQGGFVIEAGAAAAILFTLFHFRQNLRLALWGAVPSAIAAYAAILVLQLTAGAPATPLPTGTSYVTLAGEQLRPEDLKGRPLVINLWATWCPPCRREMPMMADVAGKNEDAVFVFVNQGEGREAVNRYLTKEGLVLDRVVLDSLGEFGRHYKAPGLPATLFVDNKGNLQAVHMGEISRELLEKGIARIQ